MNVLLDLPLRLSAELATCVKPTQEVLLLKAGSVVEFDHAAKAPVNLYVNKTLVARGEIVAVDDTFGIKITSLVPQPDPGSSNN